jgi:hypothetical protein
MDDVRSILQEAETGQQPKWEDVADCNPSTRVTEPKLKQNHSLTYIIFL